MFVNRDSLIHPLLSAPPPLQTAALQMAQINRLFIFACNKWINRQIIIFVHANCILQ